MSFSGSNPNPCKMKETVQGPSTEVGIISLEERADLAVQLLAGQGSVEEIIAQLAAAIGKNVTLGVSEEPESVADDDRVLAPEAQAALLERLQQRFDANMNRHEGVNWADVRRCLEADPAKLWSLQQMETAGHEPDVYMEDAGAYYFGTCSKEAPKAHRNIVFDADASPMNIKTCTGNAVDIAAAMGIGLMPEKHYRHLQTFGRLDMKTWSWLRTSDVTRRYGVGRYGNRVSMQLHVSDQDVGVHSLNGGFRGSVEVSKV